MTLEEHCPTSDFMEGLGSELRAVSEAAMSNSQIPTRFANLARQLTDVGERRVAEMDAAGIDVQVLSLSSPGTEQLLVEEAVSLTRSSNDFFAKAVERYPTRLAGFAAVPTGVPDTAADELERTVSSHSFKRALINGHCRGRYLDDKFFWSIFERAQELGVPICLHPPRPPEQVVQVYFAGNFPVEVTRQLSRAAWGWHIETAVHTIRIILSGAFDEHPKLQLIVGHLGERLPFILQRLDHNLPTALTRLDRPFSSYLRENIHHTFSGFNFVPPFLNLLMEVGVDRIMFSADYPYASMAEGKAFLDRLPVSPSDREKIAHKNAERLLKL